MLQLRPAPLQFNPTLLGSKYCVYYHGRQGINDFALVRFLKGLFHEGGFKHNAEAHHPDLQSTYQAISLLKSLKLWDSFANNRKDVQELVQKFVLSHRV